MTATFQVEDSDEALAVTLIEISRLLDDASVPHPVSYAAQLVVEELVTNAHKYGFSQRPAPPASVCLTILPGELVVEVRDAGAAFDPFSAPAPDLNLPAEERPVGRLGLHLVRNMADEFSYRRENGTNLSRVIKRWQA